MGKKKPQVQEGLFEIKNAGPIQGVFPVDVSKGPGLYTLTGGKATGKSTALKALQLLQGHKVEITVHDGEIDGYVAGWGVVAPLGARRRPSGELELETLEGATFADFIQPQGKTPETRDRECIKALIALTGVEADPSDYHELVGGKEAFKKLGIEATDDPIVLAKRVKAKLEQMARDEETVASVEKGHLESIEARIAAVDLSAPCDLNKLMQVRDAAKSKRDTLIEKADAATIKKEEIARARQQLQEQREAYKGKSVDEACGIATAAFEDWKVQDDLVRRLEEELRVAKETREALKGAHDKAVTELEQSKQHDRTMAAWEATIATKVDEPSEDELEAAKLAVEAAEAAYNTGVKVKDAKDAKEQAEIHRVKAEAAKEAAVTWREAASQAFPILTQRLKTHEIMVEQIDDEARLVVQHPTRKKKVFFNAEGDLSEGQRIMVAIRELLPRVKKPGLFDVPQHVFAGIQPQDRKELHEFAVEHGIFLWGAVISDGELEVKYGG